MAYYSSVPAAIAALAAAFRTSPLLGVAGVPVRDGPDLTAAPGTEAVAVGYTGDQAEDVVTGTASPEGLAVLPDRERYAVMCAIEVVNPDNDIAAARARAYALHAACGAAIAADHTLGQAVLRASAGIGSLQQQQTAAGALARVVFPVNVDAYTSRLAAGHDLGGELLHGRVRQALARSRPLSRRRVRVGEGVTVVAGHRRLARRRVTAAAAAGGEHQRGQPCGGQRRGAFHALFIPASGPFP